jgi:hypothetical protein
MLNWQILLLPVSSTIMLVYILCFSDKRALQQGSIQDHDYIPGRLSVQASEDRLQHPDLPSEHRREGPGLLGRHCAE